MDEVLEDKNPPQKGARITEEHPDYAARRMHLAPPKPTAVNKDNQSFYCDMFGELYRTKILYQEVGLPK